MATNPITSSPAVKPRPDDVVRKHAADGDSAIVRFAGDQTFEVFAQSRFNGSGGTRDVAWVQGDKPTARHLLEFMSEVYGNPGTGADWQTANGKAPDAVVKTLLGGIGITADQRTAPTAKELKNFMTRVFGEPLANAVVKVLGLQLDAPAALPLSTVVHALSCARGSIPALEGVNIPDSLRRNVQSKSS